MAVRDVTEGSVASALPDCAILCAICNRCARPDIKRTRRMSARRTIWLRERRTTTGDWSSDTSASLDASTVHRIWIPPRRGARRQLRRIRTQRRTESIRSAKQISTANVSRSCLSQRRRTETVTKPEWRMLVRSWAILATATPLWHNILAKRYDGSHRIPCQTGNRDNEIVGNSIPRVPCAWSRWMSPDTILSNTDL